MFTEYFFRSFGNAGFALASCQLPTYFFLTVVFVVEIWVMYGAYLFANTIGTPRRMSGKHGIRLSPATVGSAFQCAGSMVCGHCSVLSHILNVRVFFPAPWI